MVQLKIISVMLVAMASAASAFMPGFNGAIAKAATPSTIMMGRGDAR